MAQHRTVLLNSPALTVEHVEFPSSFVQLSPMYRVASRRFVFPQSGVTEFRWDAHKVLFDGITVLCLPAGMPYQMQACSDAARASIVVSEPEGGQTFTVEPNGSLQTAPSVLPLISPIVSPQVWQLRARHLWRLRRHWRALARRSQDEPVASTRAVMCSALPPPTLQALVATKPVAGARYIHSVKRDIALRVANPNAPKWTLSYVAESVNLSPYHLARLFKAQTGMTLHGYRQQLRLAFALQRLEGGEANLADLAASLGFCSQSHMGAAFQCEFGVTPAQARQQLAN